MKRERSIKVNDFLKNIIEICKKYGFSIGHEDTQGSFIIEDFKDENITWLNAASDKTTSELSKTTD